MRLNSDILSTASAVYARDPTEVIISYSSFFEAHPYLKSAVKIEVSARSMHDPVDIRNIISFVDAFYEELPFALPPFEVLCVRATITFLEKAILLHEGFEKPFSPEKAERKSRHLYDLVQLMDTEHGTVATADEELFAAIIAPAIILETKQYLVRIDKLDNDKYRYASWTKPKRMSQKPDLVLKGDIASDNECYTFKNKTYSYICDIIKIGKEGDPPAELIVLEGDIELLHAPAEIIGASYAHDDLDLIDGFIK
ncbi:MAG: nucleotidyl transferase AbiEii/AbiGii toxin family protein [Taibaiella sp.]|nr:nucleotidyl transferase AbiEii/AbiGii toxin family protein [Taibaiella sp.]